MLKTTEALSFICDNSASPLSKRNPMNTLLTINEQDLLLNRFPKSNDKNLQAWDSSDELALTHLQSLGLKPSSNILIVNDSFGALACALTQHNLFWQSDSYISQCACQQNLEDNQLSPNIAYLDSLSAPEQPIDVVLIKLPKSIAMLAHQLQMLAQWINPETVVIGLAKIKDVHKSGLALFEKHIGTTTTSLAKKKSRLIFAQPDNLDNAGQHGEQILSWPLPQHNFTISNYAGVFANNKLDIGADLMLQHIPTDLGDGYVIDLGCGNGVLGLSVAALNERATVRFTDESHMAIASAKLNVENNFPQQDRFEYDWHDCLSDYDYDQADLIICNPPFHQLKTVTDHIAWQMFNDAYRTLKHGGKLRIVGNRHLGYHIKLQRIFDNCVTIGSNGKFVILESFKK